MTPIHRDARDDGPESVPTGGPYPPNATPTPLIVAAGLTFVQGVLTLAYGIGEAANIDGDRWVLGLTTSVFFLAYGGGLMACAWGLRTIRPWSRGPVLLAQLIWLGLAWNFRQGDTLPIAIVLAVCAVIVLAGLLHPRSIDALERAAGRS